MSLPKLVLFTLLLHAGSISVIGQQLDATHRDNAITDTIIYTINRTLKLPPSLAAHQLYVPAALIIYGLSTLGDHGNESINGEVKEELYTESLHKKVSVDNYLQFAPAAFVYGLNAVGIKGKHDLRDRSMVFLLSNIILNATVISIKRISHQIRPDGSGYTSFPSGHTAEAFANAEFMRQEFKDESAWYGIAGYAMAAATGYLRLYNNKHWLSDIVAGAGVGIASTKIAYWLYPKIQHKLFRSKTIKTVYMPTYDGKSFSISMAHDF